MAGEVAEAEEAVGQVWNVASNLCSSCLDGQYESCYCDDEERLEEDLKDSGDEDEEGGDEEGEGDDEEDDDDDDEDEDEDVVDPTQKRNSIYDVYISDDEFHENDDDDDTRIELPPPTTDWDSIDSVLKGKEVEPGEEVDVELSKRLSHNVNISMVFVDSEESDGKNSDADDNDDDDGRNKNKGSVDDLRVDSRDSGYLTTDVTDASSVTEAAEESTRVLGALKLEEELEEKMKREAEVKEEEEKEFIDEVHQKNVDELRTMKEFLELHIAKINYELLEQLEIRDYLSSKNESLVMEADDLDKTNPDGAGVCAEDKTTEGAASKCATTSTPTTTTSTTTKTTTKTTTIEPNTNSKTIPPLEETECGDKDATAGEPPDPDKSPNHLTPSRSRAPKRKSFWWR